MYKYLEYLVEFTSPKLFMNYLMSDYSTFTLFMEQENKVPYVKKLVLKFDDLPDNPYAFKIFLDICEDTKIISNYLDFYKEYLRRNMYFHAFLLNKKGIFIVYPMKNIPKTRHTEGYEQENVINNPMSEKINSYFMKKIYKVNVEYVLPQLTAMSYIPHVKFSKNNYRNTDDFFLMSIDRKHAGFRTPDIMEILTYRFGLSSYDKINVSLRAEFYNLSNSGSVDNSTELVCRWTGVVRFTNVSRTTGTALVIINKPNSLDYNETFEDEPYLDFQKGVLHEIKYPPIEYYDHPPTGMKCIRSKNDTIYFEMTDSLMQKSKMLKEMYEDYDDDDDIAKTPVEVSFDRYILSWFLFLVNGKNTPNFFTKHFNFAKFKKLLDCIGFFNVSNIDVLPHMLEMKNVFNEMPSSTKIDWSQYRE